MFTESKISKKWMYKKKSEISHRKEIGKLLKSFIRDWNKLLVYAKVFAIFSQY